MIYRLHVPDPHLQGEVSLAGSKSISNRVLIIQALCGEDFPIEGLANARDTQLLQQLLASGAEELDAGAAGTTFRFLTAYLAMQSTARILTGSARMKQRPIGLLVEALRRLGGRIEYLEKEGYPPLRILPHTGANDSAEISIPAGTSSQYISALLMIGPTLPRGLNLQLEGSVVSRPYIEMTLQIMKYFGVGHSWKGDCIQVPPQPYQARPFRVEADWSAASYHYALAAFAEKADLQLNGLFADSLQGDAVLVEMMEWFGLKSTFNEKGVRITRTGKAPGGDTFSRDFVRCPDLAQTLAVICAGLGVNAHFTGLETLRIKETDRIAALRTELAKVGVTVRPAPPAERARGIEYLDLHGKAKPEGCPTFATYEDHRMAMAFAPLAMFGDIAIEEPGVVEKSYPDFWKDLEELGFVVSPGEDARNGGNS